MAWEVPQYSRRQVDKAGRFLITHTDEPNIAYFHKWDHELAIINNCRSSHGYPLQAMKMTFLNRARKVHRRALVAQRLKRLSSIALKLEQNEYMKLSQMQDTGGCRAVLANVRQVADLVDIYASSIT